MKNSNWPSGVDYSDPNHTLKTPRVSRGGYFVEPKKNRTSIVWWLLIAALILGFVLTL